MVILFLFYERIEGSGVCNFSFGYLGKSVYLENILVKLSDLFFYM